MAEINRRGSTNWVIVEHPFVVDVAVVVVVAAVVEVVVAVRELVGQAEQALARLALD